jgi:hypothetical protein
MGLLSQVPEGDALPRTTPFAPAPRGGAGRGGEQPSLSPSERVRESAVPLYFGGTRGRSGAQPTD